MEKISQKRKQKPEMTERRIKYKKTRGILSLRKITVKFQSADDEEYILKDFREREKEK